MANIHRIIVEGKMVSSNNDVYYDIAKQFSIEKQAVYLAVKRFITKKNLYRELDDDEDEDVEYVPFEYFSSDFKISPSDISFEINISKNDIFYDTDEKLLQSLEWSDTITDIVWEFSRLPCAWVFNRLRSVCNEAIIVARCKSLDCSELFAYTERDKTTLKIVIKSFNEEAIHLKKRSTKYARKEKIESLLKSNTACIVRSELSNHLMTDNDNYEPAHLPRLETLRVQKHRSLKTDYLDKNAIFALRIMKDSSKYFQCIGDIGLDPFYCVYSTPLQRELLRVHIRYRRCVTSFDATGLPERPAKFSCVREDIGEF